GMKRRLNIGVSMLHDPELLIMDEPAVGIDPQSRNYILETVKRLNDERQMTVLYTSHYMEEVEFLCNRIYIMDQGNLIASGTKEEIKQILSAEKTISIKTSRLNGRFITLLEQSPTINQVVAGEKEVTITVSKEINMFPKLIHLAEEAEQELSSVDVKTPTLEDVFLHLTGRALRDEAVNLMIWQILTKQGLMLLRNPVHLLLLVGLPIILIAILGTALGGIMNGESSPIDVKVAFVEHGDEEQQINRLMKDLGAELPPEAVEGIREGIDGLMPVSTLREDVFGSGDVSDMVDVHDAKPSELEKLKNDDSY